jgi:dipeptidyl aminopeptidase/acylaminoacyl peptidase
MHGILAGPGPGRSRRWKIRRASFTWAFHFSPDGRHVAYYEGGKPKDLGVLVADRFGNHPRRLAHYGLEPVWSPDGRRLAFWSGSGIGTHKRIYIVDVASGRVRELAGADGSVLAWSPDGKQLAFVSPRGLETIRVGGGRPHLVYRPQPSRVAISSVDWSPDGREFALGLVDMYAEEFDTPPPGPDTLARIGVNIVGRDGRDPTRIARASLVFGALPLAWSPDGRSIAVICGNSLGNPPLGICAIDRSGRRRRLVTVGAKQTPLTFDWLPR